MRRTRLVQRAGFAACGMLLACAMLASVTPVAFAQVESNSAVSAGAEATQRILALESLGRARPAEASAQLQQMLATTAEFSTERLELLTVQGLMHAIASQPDAAESAALQLDLWGRDSLRPHSQDAVAAALLVRARVTARGGNLPAADTMLQEATAHLPDTMLPRDRYRFIFTQASVKDESGKMADAVRLGHEALTLADKQDDLWRRSEARTSLAYSYLNAKQFERARTFVEEALQIAEKAQDWVAIGRGHNTAGIVLDGLSDLQGERRSFELAIDAARRAGSKIDEVRYLANLADFFLKNGDYKTALQHAERALPLARELNDKNSELVALANMGLAHISMQHIEQGTKLVREAIAIDQDRGSFSGAAETLRELGFYLEKAGDIPGAVSAYHQYRRMVTALMRDDQQKAILAMQEQYDADNRSRELALLSRESELKAEQLRRRDLQLRLWWLLAAAFLLSFAVVVLLYRRVRQTNHLLASSNELLKVQSERDPLTGLANRRHFQAAMRQLAEDGVLSGTVYLIDIDHFKHINDRYGHSVGDTVLVEVARRLRETLREHDLIVRWGGEEFVVVVQSLNAEPVDALAERMLSVLDNAPVMADGQSIPVTGSIGFATFPIGPTPLRVSWERAINLVDTAMYLAKAHGRNRAYGVRILHARDEDALEAITNSLEAAWREGQVMLTLLQGRAPLTEAAAA
jgi:diguanylate cyclase (GGDEF)-like protein